MQGLLRPIHGPPVERLRSALLRRSIRTQRLCCRGREGRQAGRCASVRVEATGQQGKSALLSADTIAQISESVSGEWEGCCCVFDEMGVPRPIPDYYIPAAYKEWDIELFDWQTQVSSRVVGTLLEVKAKKLMPTQGCEADAVAFEEAPSAPEDLSSGTPITPEGGFCLAPDALPAASGNARIEHCLPAPAGERKRTRVVHNIENKDGTRTGWRIREVEVYQEEWDGDFNHGTELFACGAGSRNVSKQPALDATWLGGSWGAVPESEGTSVARCVYHADQCFTEAVAAHTPLSKLTPEIVERRAKGDGNLASTEGELQQLLLLPANVWSLFEVAEDGSVISEAGWYVSPTMRRVSSAVYDGGKVAAVAVGTEANAPTAKE